MATPFDLVRIRSDLDDVLCSYMDAFLSEASLDRYRRACAWVMDESVKALAKGGNDGLDRVMDQPTPWMRKAWSYRRSLAKDRKAGIVEAKTYAQPKQSAVLKCAMGEGENVRKPGDVVLAGEHILVPNWKNLELAQGIRRNAFGNLPGGVMARLAREAKGTKAKRRAAYRWSVYRTDSFEVAGRKAVAYMARPLAKRPPPRTGSTSATTSSTRGGAPASSKRCAISGGRARSSWRSSRPKVPPHRAGHVRRRARPRRRARLP